MNLVITNSMRCTLLDCPFKFFCEYILRLTPKKEPDYFKWGRLVHKCEEICAKGGTIEEAVIEAREETEAGMPSLAELQSFDEMAPLANAVYDAHLLKWHDEDQYYESLGIEGKFELPLPSGFTFKGKFDDVVLDVRNGKKLLWERKTPGMVDEDYWDDKYLDSQPKGYLLALQRCHGIMTTKVRYDIYQKPQIRHKKWQTREMYMQELAEKYLLERDRFFQRETIEFTQEEIDSYYWDIDQVAQLLAWHLQEGIWPKHHPGNRRGGCSYRPFCRSGSKRGYYVRDESILNPELV